VTKTELPRWLHFLEWHLIFVCPQYIFHWHLIHLGGYQKFWKNYKTLVYVILHFTHKFTLQNKWHKNFEHYCICNGIMNLLLRQHENTSVADKTNNPKQFLRTAEFEAQLLLHCSFIKCDKTFNMASEVLHSCDLLSTEYHIIPVMSEV